MDNNRYVVNLEKSWINAGENDEIEYWAGNFNVTREQLKTAVKAVGDSLMAVEKYLNLTKSSAEVLLP